MTILAELSDVTRWVAWRSEPRGKNGKLTKVPYGAHGRKAKVDDPSTWVGRAEAETSALKNVLLGGFRVLSSRSPTPGRTARLRRFRTLAPVS